MCVSAWFRNPKSGTIRRPNCTAGQRLQVLLLEDRTVPSTFSVLNTNDAGVGSLRQAILDANGNVGFDTITFNIPGSSVHTIQPLSALPALTDAAGALIDGYTQSGASENTLIVGNDAVLRIELDGSLAGNGVNGLMITSSGNTVQGLVINRFDGDGIRIAGGSTTGTVIRGNFIGTNAAGTEAQGNLGSGINQVHGGGWQTAIGGVEPGDRNVISGNGFRGVDFFSNWGGDSIRGNYIGTNAAGDAALPNGDWGISAGNWPDGNVVIGGAGAGNVVAGGVIVGGTGTNNFVIQGNYIGTNATGTAVLVTGGTGVRLDAAHDCVVGGTTPQSANVIGGHDQGVVLSSGSENNVIQGNFVGTNVAGANLGNRDAGIIAYAEASNNTIGGVGPGEGNTIAFNGMGVVIGEAAGAGNSIRGNSIRYSQGAVHYNSDLGIDLWNYASGPGVTPNDSSDTDGGPNDFQNHPVITLAEPGSTTHVVGTLNSTPNASFSLDFYASSETGGERFLGTIEVNTDSAGTVSFDAIIANATVTGEFITATATNSAGSTSEFSFAVPAGLPAAPFVVTSTDSRGPGTLRSAILYANAHPGPDTIEFDIPGSGPKVIALTAPLPWITESIVIDGYTQSDASPNSLAVGSDAVLRIVLDGSGVNVGSIMTITGSNSTIRGLIFQHFDNWMTNAAPMAIRILGNAATGNTIAGNFIGNDGVQMLNEWCDVGILIEGGSNNTIGGNHPAERNIIAVNSTAIRISGDGNVVEGNYVGIDAEGTGALGCADGVTVSGNGNTVVGNVISNAFIGVRIDGGSGTVVQSNRIGTDAFGLNAIPNTIGVYAGSSSQVINNIIRFSLGHGVTVTGSNVEITSNIIGQNGGPGIEVAGGVSNVAIAENTIVGNGFGSTSESVSLYGELVDGDGLGIWILNSFGTNIGVTARGNSISANAGLGIELGDLPSMDWRVPDGFTHNDPGDTDSGSNDIQNFPIITAAAASSRTFVQGTLNSTPNSTFTLDFYANSAADSSGYGEGERWLGSIEVTTDSNGDATFATTLDAATALGEWITATATNAGGSTSEFSAAFELDDLAIFGTAGSDTMSISPAGGGQVTITVNGVGQNYTLAGGVYLLGGDGSDSYTITFGADVPDNIVVLDDGATGTDDLTFLGTTLAETYTKAAGYLQWQPAPAAPYKQVDFDGIDGLITLNAGGGNDTIHDPNSGNFLILGGDGDDTILIADTVGTGVTADGGSGSDTYIIDAGNLQGPVNITDSGTAGTDAVTVQGTPAEDTITQSGNQVVANGGTITLSGVQTLTVDGGGGTDEYTVETPPTIPTTVTGVTDTVIEGTSANDTIRLTVGANAGEIDVRINGVVIGTYLPTGKMIVRGLDGNDDLLVEVDVTTPVWLYGGSGDDELRAGGGSDFLFGEDGNDRLYARLGNDQLDGGAGNDQLHAGTGSDIVRGGDGCDELWGGTGNDQLYGDAGNDILRGGGGCDRLEGGDGDDELRAGEGGDTLIGGNGNDLLKGGQGSDWLEGGDGNDRLSGMAGDDVMLGGAGDDLLMGGGGRDLQIAGLGADRVEGNADEDILIAGFTLFDDNAAALNAIMAEWTSGNSYATRVANITNGTGLTQGYQLWADAGALQSVFNDDSHDVLCGGAGIDWFFANVSGSGVLDTISDLRAYELWNDTEF